MTDLNTEALVASVPKRIFSIEDFKDFKAEHELSELTYQQYKPLRADEYRETHKCDVTDAELEAQVEADLREIAKLESGEVNTDPKPVKAKRTVKKVATKTATKKAPKSKSKKAMTVLIYREVIEGGGSRKDGIARLTSELGLSPAGASTYWQNVKSGKWA